MPGKFKIFFSVPGKSLSRGSVKSLRVLCKRLGNRLQ